MQIGLFGKGRLATAIAQEVQENPALTLAWQVDQEDAPPPACDVAIDATVAEAVEGHLAWALETKTDLVIGATGWSIPDLRDRVGREIGVLVAPNFSLSVALMQRLAAVLARYSEENPTLDPFVLEHHHKMKADYPSGTAKMLAETVIDNHEGKVEWTLGTAGEGQLSLGVLRAGSEFGMHIVGLDGPAEILEIRHQARSRAVFAQGALRAAGWIRGKKGVFSFADLAEEVLDPLFKF
jgi:4-hydroxy-tetrahydrodipicolinate reductase